MASTRAATALRRRLLRRAVPYGLFGMACALSLLASWYLSSSARETAASQARSEFFTDAQQMRRQMQAGLNSYFEVVRAGAVLISSDYEISGAEFRRFVEGLQLPDRYPGLRGIGFVQCIPSRDAGRFVRLMSLDGNRITIWPDTGQATRCPTVFLEPERRDASAPLGFDVASVPALADVMASARDSGQAVVSPTIDNLEGFDREHQANAVLFIPVYRVPGPLASVEARRQALVGFVMSPFNSQRLIEDVVRVTIPSVTYEVYDSTEPTAEASIARSLAPEAPVRYESFGTLDIPGREWLVAVRALGEPLAIEPAAARQTLVGGLVLSLMLFLITSAQFRAWETAARHEAELSASAEALRESEAQAHAANRAKDEFLATLSHELRTPLNVVLGWVSMLRHSPPREDRLMHALEIIERNARQQADLIDDLLDVSRIVTGKLRLEMRPVALAPIVATVAESLRPGADAKGVTLTLLALAEASMVLGDPDRLRQTFWNLLSNAIKFTPADGSVFVELTRDEHRVRLVVRDTGIGIPQEFLPHVFERFRQADSSTTRTHSGVGLGLAIVRDLVEMHGGTVEAQSEGVGCGATFILELPAISIGSTAPAHGHGSTAADTPDLHGVRVLVVDDDPGTLEMLTEALGTARAQVTSAASARHALERLRTEGADVIVSDIAMPGEDGLWLVEHVRRLPGRKGLTPAIALTALARGEDRARILRAGYQMHLTKPVQLDELQSGVAALAAAQDSELRV